MAHQIGNRPIDIKLAFNPPPNKNTYRYSDILILMRTNTELATLEQALRKEAIPYTLGGKSRGLPTLHPPMISHYFSTPYAIQPTRFH